jgi:putative inorganic carbon (hco3(-)) transporter
VNAARVAVSGADWQPPQALLLAATGVAAWAAITQQPALMLAAAAAVTIALAIAGTAEGSVLGLVLLLGTVAADASGRVATIAGVRLTVYQLAAALIVAVLVWGVSQRAVRLVPSVLDIPALLFLAIAAVTLIGAQDPRAGLVAFASLASSVVLAFLVYYLVDTPRKASVVVLSTLAIATVLAALAVLERQGIYSVQSQVITLWTTGIRARVTFKDPNILGTFLMASTLLAAPLAFALRSWKHRVLALAGLALTVAGLIATFSRGAWLGLAVGAVVMLVCSPIRRRRKVAIVGAVLAAALLITPFALESRFVQTKVLGVVNDASVVTRVSMDEGALRMFADNPLGVGLGNYAVTYPRYRNDVVRSTLVESHNAYLTVIVEMGLFGFAVFLWILWRFFRATRTALRGADRRVVMLAVGVIAAGVGIATQAMTYSLEGNKLFWLTIGLGMAAARMARPDPVEETP